MASIVETTQVVAVLALLPLILLCLLIMEPFDQVRLRIPALLRGRRPQGGMSPGTMPGSELA